jgi:hypothetical protein
LAAGYAAFPFLPAQPPNLRIWLAGKIVSPFLPEFFYKRAAAIDAQLKQYLSSRGKCCDLSIGYAGCDRSTDLATAANSETR